VHEDWMSCNFNEKRKSGYWPYTVRWLRNLSGTL